MERAFDVRADGVRLAARGWEGDAPGVLLLHGLASSSHIWDLVAPRLAPALRVIAYDQRGHGRSGKPTSGYGFERVLLPERAEDPQVVGSRQARVDVAVSVDAHEREEHGLDLVRDLDLPVEEVADRLEELVQRRALQVGRREPLLRRSPVHPVAQVQEAAIDEDHA